MTPHDDAQTGPLLRTATPDESPAVRTLLARSFAEDPLMAYALPEPEHRLDAIALWFAPFVERYLLLGRGRVAVDGDGAVVAAALWRRPDDDLAAGPAGDLLPTPLGAIRVLLGAAGAERFTSAMAAVREAAPPLHGVYLHLLGVAPGARRRGFGRALVDDGVAAARDDGHGVFLTTCSAENVAFYRSAGLEVLAEDRLPGGPPVWQVGTPDAVVRPA